MYLNYNRNYMMHSPMIKSNLTDHPMHIGKDPIQSALITYENSTRISDFPMTLFTQMFPFVYMPCIPKDKGYHLYSYMINLKSLLPCGSMKFGKITNIMLVPRFLEAATMAGTGTSTAGEGSDFPQKFQLFVITISQNILNLEKSMLSSPSSNLHNAVLCRFLWTSYHSHGGT